jgi:hypothetical protein
LAPRALSWQYLSLGGLHALNTFAHDGVKGLGGRGEIDLILRIVNDFEVVVEHGAAWPVLINSLRSARKSL